MNNDLISRSELKKVIHSSNLWGDIEWLLMDLDEIIDKAPAVTVDNYAMGYQDGVRKVLSERPKGKWVKDEEHSITIEMFKCTICGFWNGAEHFRFCPSCGADMKND